jgi:hypothetical protein
LRPGDRLSGGQKPRPPDFSRFRQLGFRLAYSLLRFGRHWNFSVKRAEPFKVGRKMVARAEPEFPRAVAASQEEIQSARDWIRKTEPTIEQIERQAVSEVR